MEAVGCNEMASRNRSASSPMLLSRESTPIASTDLPDDQWLDCTRAIDFQQRVPEVFERLIDSMMFFFSPPQIQDRVMVQSDQCGKDIECNRHLV